MPDNDTNIKITEYNAFLNVLEDVGFMPLSANCIRFINLSDLTDPEQWHSGLAEDPWQWRIKIETDGKAAYAKLFDKKPGFISREWYPLFLAARRKGRCFEELYTEGLISNEAKNIYTLFEKHETLAIYEIKDMAGFTRETHSKCEAALCELQMGMFITIDGTKQKINGQGEPYGWPATAYSTVEKWAGEALISEAQRMNPQDAMEQIIERVRQYAPDPASKKIGKFLGF